MVKENVKCWNREVFRNLEISKEELRLKLEDLAKVKWLKKGDVNSKKIHRVATEKRIKFIKRLEVSPGEEMNRPRIVGLEWGTIDQAIAMWLERPFDELEIRKAIFDCERGKTPGQDGFSMAIFQDLEYKSLENEGLIFKVDFEKVYDHVDWPFLDFVMDKKGYGGMLQGFVWATTRESIIPFSFYFGDRHFGKDG
ncbi:hypothetical protein CsSME_00011449 [Camellia sinensis var. sinensis]